MESIVHLDDMEMRQCTMNRHFVLREISDGFLTYSISRFPIDNFYSDLDTLDISLITGTEPSLTINQIFELVSLTTLFAST